MPRAAGPNDPEPKRFQTVELPPITVEVTEYQAQARICSGCGEVTHATIPADIRAHSVGPRLTATLSYLTGCHGLSKRGVEEIAETVFGVPIALGTVVNLEQEVSAALAPAHQEVLAAVRGADVKFADETSWKLWGKLCWLWAAATAGVAAFVIHARRSAAGLAALLGAEIQGILCSDRFSAYLKYHSGKAQFCWAHLKRNLLGIVEYTKSSAVEQFCRDALAQHARLFRLWHKFRGGQIDRRQLLLRSIPIQKRIFDLAGGHLDSPHREVRNLATALFEHNGRLFTFLEHEAVEPTNNSAERALRTGVQWRKICFGNRSQNGELATARLLTVAETCDLQHLNILAYLSAAIACHRNRKPAASLLHR